MALQRSLIMKNKSQLVRGKITIETEIVVENFYGESPEKCIESAWRGNRNEIISQACESGNPKITKVSIVTKKEQLPPAWDVHCLPWLPNIAFGDKKQEVTIGKFLS